MQLKTYNKDFKARIQKFLERQYFMHHIGFALTQIEVGRTEGWLDLKKIHLQQKGLAHGGLISTLADIVAGFAAYTLVAEDHHVVTGEIKISYLRPGLGSRLHAVGWVLKQGKKMNFCESEVWSVDDNKRTLIAKATTTMITLFPGEIKEALGA